jgi:predicted NAD/FAD-binding protein
MPGVKLVVRAGAGPESQHPEFVARMVRLGFDADAATLARVVRLRRDLGLNYAGALLASDLLARIDELQARLRRYER